MSRPDIKALEAATWWHGGATPLGAIDWTHPRHGGLHLGTQAQAAMRGPHLTPFRLYRGNRLRLVADRGGDWARRAQDARRRGFDALVYLNRHEGLSWDDLAHLADPDALSCAAFARAVPQARFSLVILRPGVARALAPAHQD